MSRFIVNIEKEDSGFAKVMKFLFWLVVFGVIAKALGG